MSAGQLDNEQSSNPSNSIRTENFRINQGDLLKIRVSAVDGLMANERALVCQIIFFDEQGAIITDEITGASISPKFGNFIYIRSVAAGQLALWAREIVHAPHNAAMVRLILYPWKASRQLRIAPEIECKDYRRITKTSTTSTITPNESISFDFEVLPFWRIAYSFDVLQKASEKETEVKFIISFVDTNDNVIEVQPSSANAIFGSVHECNEASFFLVPDTTDSEYDGFIKQQADILLSAPIHAVKMRVTVLVGGTSARVLFTQSLWAFESLIESRLTVESATQVYRCKSLPRELQKYSYTKLLEKFPDTLSAYAAALDYFSDHNHVLEVSTVANQILNRFQQPELLRKARRALASSLVSDPMWLPDTGQWSVDSAKISVVPIETNVAHLMSIVESSLACDSSYFSQLTAFQKNLNNAKAFIVTPACHSKPSEQTTVWELRESNGIKCYDLNCLLTEDAFNVPATTLLSFTSIVMKQVLVAESATIIHAHDSQEPYNFALLGLALSKNLCIPLVYERRRPFVNGVGERFGVTCSSIDSASEQEMRCIREAHVIILPENTEIECLDDYGIDHKKIFFLPEIEAVQTDNSIVGSECQNAVNDVYKKAYQFAWQALQTQTQQLDTVPI